MTDKELRKLNRSQLLELLLAQSREMDRLRQELAETQAALRSREIKLEQCGSIAEASLALSHIFAEAQRAADLYLENVKRVAAGQSTYVRVAESEGTESDGPRKTPPVTVPPTAAVTKKPAADEVSAQPSDEEWDTFMKEVKYLCGEI